MVIWLASFSEMTTQRNASPIRDVLQLKVGSTSLEPNYSPVGGMAFPPRWEISAKATTKATAASVIRSGVPPGAEIRREWVVGCLPSDPILQGLPGIKGILQVIGGAGGGGRGDLIFAALETVRSHEVGRVCGEPIRVLRRIGAKRVGDLSKAVARKGVGDDQDAEVAAMILESLHGQAEEIVPFAGDETPALARGPVELLSVREALGADVVNA